MSNIALEQEAIAAANYDCTYTVFTRFGCTPTARSTETEQRLCSKALTSEEVFYKNFTHIRSGSHRHLIFEQLFLVCS